MKKLFALILTAAVLGAMAIPSYAQRRSCRTYYPSTYSSSSYSNRTYASRSSYDNRSYYDYGYRNRNFWDRHRDKLTVAIGTGAGAAIGAMTGGRKGAAIGALLGAGGSALYTYKIRNRRYRY